MKKIENLIEFLNQWAKVADADGEDDNAAMFRQCASALSAQQGRVSELERAIHQVLADEESRPGAWGPDVTCIEVLRAVLTAKQGRVEGTNWVRIGRTTPAKGQAGNPGTGPFYCLDNNLDVWVHPALPPLPAAKLAQATEPAAQDKGIPENLTAAHKLDSSPAPAAAPINECICPKCGIRHGGSNVQDPGF